MEGIIQDDSAIPRLKNEFIRLKSLEMIENGYSPRLDIEPNFTLEYNSTKEYFEFKLTVYGTYLGKSKSKWTTGIDGTMVLPTAQSKSKESSQAQESTLNQK